MGEKSRRSKLGIMAEKSAAKYNNPYPILGSNVEGSNIFSIDWDNPDWEVSRDDPRWILPEGLDLGAHDWYRSLPEHQQIDIGMKRIANVTRTGLEFEQALLSGIALRTQLLIGERHYDEFVFMTQEAKEEQHHILMFNEMIRRIDVNTYGSPGWFRSGVTPIVGPAARHMPAAFYAGVLAGEEPIDHIQQTLVKMHDEGHAEVHPMVYKVMSVHIEEEGRHIMGADDLLGQYLPRMNEHSQKAFAKIYPAIARAGINATLVPSEQARQDMDMPKSVAKQIWFDSGSGRQALQDLSFRARRRAEQLGLRDPKILGKTGKKIWQILEIDGPTTRPR